MGALASRLCKGETRGTKVQEELPMGAVAPSGQGVQKRDAVVMANVPEGQSMQRV